MSSRRVSKEKSSKDQESYWSPTRDSETQKSKSYKENVRAGVAMESGSTTEPKSVKAVITSLGIDNNKYFIRHSAKIGEMGIPIRSGWRYILKHLTVAPKIQYKVLKSEEQPQRNRGIQRNHLHCYGWIESDKYEERGQDFLYFKPATENAEAKETKTPNLPSSMRSRKSRWDEKSNDP